MDFRQLKTLNIPDGVVIKIATPDGLILWQRDKNIPDLPIPQPNEIYYTTTDSNIVIYQVLPSDNTLISNTYENGVGRMVFEKELTEMVQWHFGYKSNLKTIIIPDSVTSIGRDVFRSCYDLKSIIIPNSVTSIGIQCFYDCTSLEDITLPEGLQYIDSSAFHNCPNLKTITIPSSIISILGNVFPYNIFITSNSTKYTIENDCLIENRYYLVQGLVNETYYQYNIPDSVTSIGSYAFQRCPSLTSITIPNTVTRIHHSAFHNCPNLKTITIPNTVTYIGSSCFYYCTSLEDITLPDGLTTIDNQTFLYCSSLTSIIIPDSVTTIGNSCFYNCTSLEDITLPEGLQYIGSNTFYNCNKIKSITIPSTIFEISSATFPYNIPITSNSAKYIIIDNCLIDTEINKLVQGLVNKTDYQYNIPDSVTSIGNYAFLDCTNLKSITIPNSVTTIGNNCFKNCTSLEDITLPDGLTTIDVHSFNNCTNLKSITIPKSVTTIGNNAFVYCNTLNTITCLNPIAPTLEIWVFGNVGSNVPSGTKILRVPEGAEGYDVWLEQLPDWKIEYITE